MADTPVCPHCNIYLNYDYMTDDYQSDNFISQSWYGFCTQCKRTYHWTEIYTLTDIENFSEELA